MTALPQDPGLDKKRLKNNVTPGNPGPSEKKTGDDLSRKGRGENPRREGRTGREK